MSENERLKVGDRIVRDANLQAVAARPTGEDRPVYVVVKVIDDAIVARPERWEGATFAPLVAERITKGDLVTLGESMQHVRPARLAEERVSVGGVAVDSFDVGEVAIFDAARGRLYKKS